MTSFSQNFTLNAAAGKTTWYLNPGADGSFWKTPFYDTAQFDTTSNQRNILINGANGNTPFSINVGRAGTFGQSKVNIGFAGDPLIPCTDGKRTVNVRIPVGSTVWGPGPQGPFIVIDTTQPYLILQMGGDTTIANPGPNNTVQAGSSLSCTFNFCIVDGSGPIMADAIQGIMGAENCIGGIQDWELASAKADPNYVIQHMLAYLLDPSQVASGTPAWPLLVADMNTPYTGAVQQGLTIGIPKSVARPLNKSRGFYLLFDNLQQQGWFFYNVSQSGGGSISCYSDSVANDPLAQDCAASIAAVTQYAGILTNQSGLSSMKGFAAGGQLAYPSAPPLDFSPTGGVPVKPSTFGAWYPSTFAPFNNVTGTGYDVPSPG